MPKPHYPILDGLRGVAAILVVIFHLLEAYFPVMANHPMHHGYLAVDFFYLLSGFVVGYAYDDRWGTRMTIKEFFKIRLIRLHPLVILGVFIGALCFWFDPYTNLGHQAVLPKLIVSMAVACTLLPSPDVRGWGETHSLDGPCWSLLQEYIANIFYATFARKMGRTAFWVLVIISAIALIKTSVWHGDLATGWGYDTLWIAFVRMMFPFFAGLLLFRMGKLIRIPNAFFYCSATLAILFCLPTFPYSGWYDAACIICIFPLIVAAGAGGQIGGRSAKLCSLVGAISYPIYILHYPFIYVYTMWVVNNKPSPEQIVPVAVVLFIFFFSLAWVALKFYDEPVRAWLKRKYLNQKITDDKN